MNEPFFAAAITGMFVRVQIGGMVRGEQTGKMYRMAEVEGVVPAKNFYIWGSFKSDKKLRVSIAGRTTDLRLSQISNHRILNEEFDFYRSAMTDNRSKLPTKNDITRKRKTYEKAAKHVYTHEEISKAVGLKKLKALPFSSQILTLNNKLEEARAVQDYEMMELAQKELKLIEDKMEQARQAAENHSAKLLNKNKEAREMNRQRDHDLGIKLKAEEDREMAELENGVGVKGTTANPFARRETRPQKIWKTGAALSVTETEMSKENEAKVVLAEQRQKKAELEENARKKALSEANEKTNMFRTGERSVSEIKARIGSKYNIDIDKAASLKRGRGDAYVLAMTESGSASSGGTPFKSTEAYMRSVNKLKAAGRISQSFVA